MVIVSNVRLKSFEVAHMITRIHSVPYGIPSRGRSAGAMKLGSSIDLDSRKPVTVETT